nr:hypothetical protein JVH1_0013 [Rhodococcus sp. JVH1]
MPTCIKTPGKLSELRDDADVTRQLCRGAYGGVGAGEGRDRPVGRTGPLRTVDLVGGVGIASSPCKLASADNGS